jgi:hypothetical protein
LFPSVTISATQTPGRLPIPNLGSRHGTPDDHEVVTGLSSDGSRGPDRGKCHVLVLQAERVHSQGTVDPAASSSTEGVIEPVEHALGN